MQKGKLEAYKTNNGWRVRATRPQIVATRDGDVDTTTWLSLGGRYSLRSPWAITLALVAALLFLMIMYA